MAHERNPHRMVPPARTFASGAWSRRVDGARFMTPDRRFDLFDPTAPPPKEPSRAPLFVVPLVIGALLVAAFARSLMVRALLPLALAAAAVFILVQRARRLKAEHRERTSRRGL